MNEKKTHEAIMTEKKILTDAIRNIGLSSKSKTMWICHPMLEDIAINFAGCVGSHSITDTGKSLLEVSLNEAFSKYKKEIDVSQDERAAKGEFVRTLIKRAAEIFEQQLTVETPGGELEWNQFVCSATEFVANFPPSNIACVRVPSKISAPISQAMVTIKILPHAMLDSESMAELLNEKIAQ